MKRIRSLIVDDEPLARGRIRMLLEGHEDFEIAGEAADGDEALREIGALRPDLIFLDVEMPGLSGLEMIERLAAKERPLVVFLTAYDEYAVDAFEAAAIDYLLKPIAPDRFEKALDRIRATLSSRAMIEDAHVAMERLFGEMGTSARPRRFVVRKARGRRVIVRTDAILWVTAERNYVRLHTNGASHLLRETMSNMEELLSPTEFARIHRSAIVRVDAIREIDTEADGSFFVTMLPGERLSVGAAFRANLEKALGYSL